MAYKIAFFGAKPYDIASFDKVNEKYNYDIRYYKGHLNPNNVVLTQDTDVVCIFVNDTADAAVIDAMVDNGVKLLALRCAGFNNVDLKAAKGKLPVVRVPAYSPYAVAEYSLALMLSLNRKIHRAYWRTRDGNFSLNGLMGFDMHGKTIGIIGTGKIAKILIRLLKGFGMRILAYDLYPDMKFAGEEGISYVSLDELYRESDIISLHCPLTDQTKYMIDKDSIDKMKEGVMIINTGRGQLINTNDLIEGLKEKKIAAAGLDVYEEEGEYFYEDTLQLSIGGMFFGLLLGFILALMRLSPIWPVRWLARFYISIFRGTPLIAQLFMIYYGLPQFGIELDPIPSAMIGLSLNTAAYAAETLRAAISSIDKGQWEAAASIGMTPWQTMRRAILPQAARVALPPLSNSFISLVKDTSLAATIQVPELFRQAQLITSRTLDVFTMYLAASLIYWIMATVLSTLQNHFENQLNRQEREPK